MTAHVVVAPDKFRGSLTAAEVATHVATGLHSVVPDLPVVVVPVADGGEGTVASAVAAGFAPIEVTASGPTGEPVRTGYARRGDLAVVELATVCGLARLPGGRPAPMTASSYGLGEVVRAAVADGARRIVLGLGGSASTDGGAGLLEALGARLLDASGVALPRGGAALLDLDRIDLTAVTQTIAGVEIVVAGDVDNPLTGPAGAAAVYGPQKGADAGQVARLDAALRRFAEVLAQATSSDRSDEAGAGAAGGVGLAAVAALGAHRRPGIEVVLDLVGFADRLPGARLVITGEGALDAQTLAGKAPAGVAAAARSAGVPTVAVCGRNTLAASALAQVGIDAAYALTDIESDRARCIADAGPLLVRLAATVARERLS